MTKKLDLFRCLVLLTLFGHGLTTLIGWNAVEHAPIEQSELFDWIGHGALVDFHAYMALYLAWLFLHTGGLLALFFYLPVGRWMVVADMLLSVLMAAIGGTWVITPVESAASAISYFFFTFVVGMAFFSAPVLVRLRQNHSGLTSRSIRRARARGVPPPSA